VIVMLALGAYISSETDRIDMDAGMDADMDAGGGEQK
jgi:hypothetical protein